MLLRATENAVAGHIWPAGRYLPTLALNNHFGWWGGLIIAEFTVGIHRKLRKGVGQEMKITHTAECCKVVYNLDYQKSSQQEVNDVKGV